MSDRGLLVPVSAGVFLLEMLLLVPFPDVKRLNRFGLGYGFFLSLAILGAGIRVLHLWRFEGAGPMIGGVPVVVSFAWYPVEVIYAYAFERFNRGAQRIGLILASSFGAMLFYAYLKSAGRWMDTAPWGNGGTLALAAAIQSILGIRLWRRREIRPKSSIPPLW